MDILRVNEINNEFSRLVPADHLDLVGVKLVEKPNLPDLELVFPEDGGQPTIWLIINPDRDILERKSIELDTTLPQLSVSDVGIPLYDMLDESADLLDTLKDVVLVILKRNSRIKIERLFPWAGDVEITLSVGGFGSCAECVISDLADFIDQTPETEEEWGARHSASEESE